MISIDEAGQADVRLVDAGAVADVYVDAGDEMVVKKAAALLTEDIERVTGKRPTLVNEVNKLGRQAVLVGTLGKSGVIDSLVKSGKLDGSKLNGQWESFALQTVEQPLPGVDRALVIVGSDRRGTAFGIFELSEQIGVSPWYWWADVTPTHRDRLIAKAGARRVGPPTVKYRGIFINDEDWGLERWSAKTFEPELGNIGPKTYEKVFELLLRLKGNYLWPAMHHCSTEFGAIERNSVLADEWGIVMGASHCEPMNRNNVWWDEKERGPWRWDTNREGMIKYWEEWAQQRGKYEALWTVGMRGIHDSPMRFPPDMPGQVKALGDAITAQRDLLKKYVAPDVAKVPQVFMAYKEALAHYQNGLTLPDDVTTMWCDDNFGYIRQLSTPDEQKRSGGAGVYYHISYLGRPQPYLWLNTTPPALIWSEMTKALDYGADRIWVVNVGDIKPGELGMEFWMRLAWNKDRYDANAQTQFLNEWATREFGVDFATDLSALMNDYYRLGFQRKPEQMQAGSFDVVNYDETARRLVEYRALRDCAESIHSRVPADKRDAYYQLVLYPVRMAAATAEVFANVDLGRLYALQGRVNANELFNAAETARGVIDRETAYYNDQLVGGKWRGIMTAGGIDTRYLMPWPPLTPMKATDEPHMGVVVEGHGVPVQPIVGFAGVDVDRLARDAAFTSPWELKRDGANDVLTVRNGVGDVAKGGQSGTATFTFDVPHDGKYALFAYVNCSSNKDDSWFLRVDGGEWATTNDRDTRSQWQWTKQDDYDLKQGKHSIEIGHREDGVMISKLRLTTLDVAQRLDEQYTDPQPALMAAFDRLGDRRFIEIFNSSERPFEFAAKPDVDWIKLDVASGTVTGQQRVWVEVDRDKLPADGQARGTITLSGAGTTQVVQVSARKAEPVPVGVFEEANGYVSIEAENFSRSRAADDAAWKTVEHLGRSGDAVTIVPTNAGSRVDANDVIKRSPSLEYDVDIRSAGEAKIIAYCLPTHRINAERGLRYAISIDDAAPTIVDFNETGGGSGEQSAEWLTRVARNTAASSTTHSIARPGPHTVRLWMVDPGVVVDKLVVDMGGMKPSELGPPETK
jgi:hypothetical protein